jgi:hypothetical protein
MGELSAIADARASPTGANTRTNNRNCTRIALKSPHDLADSKGHGDEVRVPPMEDS